MPGVARVLFFGGLGEIGRNCACIEVDGRILVIDCGLMFPEVDMPGVDLVLPDFSYLVANADKIDGIVLTHGHEDHVGGLSYLLREVRAPIFGSELCLGLARARINEAGLLDRTELIPVADGERRAVGSFDCQFIPVTHSVPHGFAIAVFTSAGTILHTGDFKLDVTPVDGRVTDLALLGELARRDGGIRLLLSDSTNAEQPGHTKSESSIGPVMRDLFREYGDRRIIAACFSSHLHRVQQIAAAALDAGRSIAFLGRSMSRNVELARELGLVDIPEDRVVDIAQIDRFAPSEICVICTGSQGEPLAALSLMAAHESKWVKISQDDLVLISATPIPGNEPHVHRVIDGLHRAGAEVVHGGVAPVHVSGHASAEELKFLLTIVQPDYLVPIHGEYRHMFHHARLARDVGMPEERIAICRDGDAVVLGPEGMDIERHAVPAGYLYVDGIVGGIDQGVLRDRRALSEEGMVVVVVTVDIDARQLATGPEIVTRGWVDAPESEELIEEAEERVRASLMQALDEGVTDSETLRRHARTALARLIKERTRRRPVVIPVVMEV